MPAQPIGGGKICLRPIICVPVANRREKRKLLNTPQTENLAKKISPQSIYHLMAKWPQNEISRSSYLQVMTGTVQDLHSHLILVQDGARGVNPFRLRVVVADEAPGQEPHHERCTKEMR